jgi:hypothetical protein
LIILTMSHMMEFVSDAASMFLSLEM